MVFGANTHRLFARMLAASTEESDVRDPWVTRMWNMPATVVSSALEEPLDWPDATVVRGDAIDVIARLKAGSARRHRFLRGRQGHPCAEVRPEQQDHGDVRLQLIPQGAGAVLWRPHPRGVRLTCTLEGCRLR